MALPLVYAVNHEANLPAEERIWNEPIEESMPKVAHAAQKIEDATKSAYEGVRESSPVLKTVIDGVTDPLSEGCHRVVDNDTVRRCVEGTGHAANVALDKTMDKYAEEYPVVWDHTKEIAGDAMHYTIKGAKTAAPIIKKGAEETAHVAVEGVEAASPKVKHGVSKVAHGIAHAAEGTVRELGPAASNMGNEIADVGVYAMEEGGPLVKGAVVSLAHTTERAVEAVAHVMGRHF